MLSDPHAVEPTFTAPSGPASLTFQLVVDDGHLSSSPSTVAITVEAQTPPAGSDDLARLATATASSQNSGTYQTADKAIDGIVDGYPGDYTKEWAARDEGVGAWLKLTWPTAVTLDSIVLHDRPVDTNQYTAAVLEFSDGSSVPVGALPNDGTGLTVSFSARTITSVTLRVTAVSATTINADSPRSRRMVPR